MCVNTWADSFNFASSAVSTHFSSSFITSSSCCTVSFQLLASNLSNVSSLLPLNFSGFSPLRTWRFRRFQNTRRSEEHTSELQSRRDLVCRLLLEKKKKRKNI